MKIFITYMKKNDWMYMLIFGIFTMIFILAASVTYADDRDKIFDQCSMRYRGELEMINICFSQQIRSYNNVKRYFDKYLRDVDPSDLSNISDEASIIINCSNKWRDVTFDTYKWDLLDYCISGL